MALIHWCFVKRSPMRKMALAVPDANKCDNHSILKLLIKLKGKDFNNIEVRTATVEVSI